MSFSIKNLAANTKDLLMTVIIQYRNSGKYRLQIKLTMLRDSITVLMLEIQKCINLLTKEL